MAGWMMNNHQTPVHLSSVLQLGASAQRASTELNLILSMVSSIYLWWMQLQKNSAELLIQRTTNMDAIVHTWRINCHVLINHKSSYCIMDDPSSIFTWLLTMAAIPLVVRPPHFMSDSQKQTKNSIPRRRRSRTTVDPH